MAQDNSSHHTQLTGQGKGTSGRSAAACTGPKRRPRRIRAPQQADDAKEITGSTAKALGILERVAENQGRPAAISEISVALGLSKPTGHRIATALEEMGFLKREVSSRRLIEGDRLVRLAFNVLAAAAVKAPRHGILEKLAETTGETCNLGVVLGNQVAYIDRVESRWPLGLRFEPGSRVPMHCTAIGKLFLSLMSPKQRDRALASAPLARYTDNTITDPAALRRELDRIRKEKVSTDNQEFMSGVVCIAVPILRPDGRLCAGLALSAPQARLTLDQARGYLPLLQDASKRLSQSFLGEE
jgi:DNA-binding IclR family transcriptional regulator